MRDEARLLRRRLTQAEAHVAALEALPQIRLRRTAGRVARKLGVRK
jgi:hypothetical protein